MAEFREITRDIPLFENERAATLLWGELCRPSLRKTRMTSVRNVLGKSYFCYKIRSMKQTVWHLNLRLKKTRNTEFLAEMEQGAAVGPAGRDHCAALSGR